MTLIQRLTLHHGLAGLSLGVFIAVQTLFLQEKGMSLTQIGLLFGAYASATTLLELPLGAVADRYGRVRVYALSRLLTLLAALLCLVGTAFGWLFAALALAGVGRALDSGGIQAWQVDALKIAGLEPQLDRLIGRFHSSVALGLAIGAIVGGYLPQWLGAPLPNGNPTHWNLLLQAGLTGLHLVLLGWLFREGEHRGDPTTTPLLHLLRQALQAAFRLPTLRLVMLVTWVVGLLLFALETYWQPRLRTLTPDGGYALFGWLASGYFVAAALGPWVLSRLLRRTDGDSGHWLGGLLWLVAGVLALLALQRSLAGFALAYLGFMFCLSMLNVPLETLLARSAPAQLRSTLFSLMSLSLQAGGLALAYGLSWCLRWLGIPGLWLLLAGVTALTALIVIAAIQADSRT